MKLLIASDIHGSAFSARKIANELKDDMRLIILGDIYNHGPRNPLPEQYAPMQVAVILNSLKDKLTAIQGNCDSEVDQMISDFTLNRIYEMNTGGKKLFFSHGHVYNFDNPPDGLKKGDCVFYGHFHIPFIKEKDGIYFINPGSCSLPFNSNPKSYALLDTDDFLCKIMDFDGNVLFERYLK